MTFHVGQKVVCVRDIPEVGNPYPWPKGLHCGSVYTIREIEFKREGYDPRSEPCGIRLQEIVRPLAYTTLGYWEPAFASTRFRPLIERNTDISTFTSLLDPSNHTPLPEHQPQRRKVSHDLCGNE